MWIGFLVCPAAMVTLARCGGCNQEHQARQTGRTPPSPASTPSPASSSAPTPTPAATPSPLPAGPSPTPTESATPPEVKIKLDTGTGLEEGWMAIETVDTITNRAWVEGGVEDGDKLVISTRNVRRFKLDLSRLNVHWEKRVVLRLDGFNRELTRKSWPTIVFERNDTGAWISVDE